MKKELIDPIKTGRCVLLLGAGASYGSKNAKSQDLFMGEQLSEHLCRQIDVAYRPGMLGKVYSIADKALGSKLVKILEDCFKNTTPSLALNKLAEHVWPRIYTLNIDDAADTAFRKKSKQKINIRTIDSAWNEADTLFRSVDLVKLNGCVSRPSDGFIFSPSEYASASNRPHEWYRQLGRDFLNYTFIFIGTKLDEPLFYQQIEYYKSVWSGAPGVPGKAYLITPEIDEIDLKSLSVSNIEHIPGTLEDFVRWVDDVIDNRRSPMAVASIRHPELAISESPDNFDDDFSRIIRVDANNLMRADVNRGRTREFYLGFKPTWNEIFENVPANLSFQEHFEKEVGAKQHRLYSIVGPAGSGKTTSLMLLAKKMSDQGEVVYFLKEPISNLSNIIKKLEMINERSYYFFVDRASSVLDGIIYSLESSDVRKVIFVVGERLNVWRRRSEWALSSFSPLTLKTNEISDRDASVILQKLEEFGPWSKIAKIPSSERKRQLVEKSKRQLLIGLLELTIGYGFEKIIADDFNKLTLEESKLFVVLVGLATIHGLTLSQDTCLAALNSLGVRSHIDKLLLDTQGIIHRTDNRLRARHPVYVDKLFDGNTPLKLKEKAVQGLLSAMARHQKPISKNMTRNDVMLFKLAINHNFLKNYFHGKNEEIIKLFQNFEKHFELDGLFYLQYGLALRDMEDHDQALRKLQSAVDSWAMKQTEHAYAHQLLICALQSSKEIAYRNLDLAKGILLRIDSRYVEEDTDYPLVTLAEYHVRIAKKFESQKSVSEITNHYVGEISDRQRRGRSNVRLDAAKAELIKIATNSEGGRRRKSNFLSEPSRAKSKIIDDKVDG